MTLLAYINRQAAAGLTVAALLSCSTPDEQAGAGSAAVEPIVTATRTYVDLDGDTVAVVGAAPDDSLLLDPGPTGAAGARIAIFDYGDGRLKMFDSTGVMAWAAGRWGEGPGEWMNPVDVELDGNLNTWVADGRTGRVTVVDSVGSLVATWRPAGDWLLSRLVLLRDTPLIIVTTTEPTFWIEVRDSQTVGTSDYPTADLRAAAAVRRTAIVAVEGTRRRWAAVFLLADRFHVFDGQSSVCEGRLVKGTPLLAGRTGDDAGPAIWAASVTFLDSTVLVLARDRGFEDDLQVIDEYSASNCEYRRSFRWTKRLRSISATDRFIFLEETEPWPHLIILRR